MNRFTLKFEDHSLEKEFFWWSFHRDYFILKVFLGSLVIVVQFPSIIISIYNSDNQIAMGWGFLMAVSVLAFCFIRYKPKSYNFLLSIYHILIMCVNVYYLFSQKDSKISDKYGEDILFVYAAAHGTSHSTIAMLGTHYLMNSLSMMTAFFVYAFAFLDKGFNTFHLFLLFIAAFTLFGKYMRDRSQREMFLMRERENKWLNIMKKALPSSIILVKYNEKLDKINLDLVNQNAKTQFNFQNDQSFSQFSRKMQLEKYINFEMTLSNSYTDKFINVDLTNNQSGQLSTLQQYINARFRDLVREKNQSPKAGGIIQNLKSIKNKMNNSEMHDRIEQSNSLSNYSKQVTQNMNFGNQPSNFFPGDQKEFNSKSPPKPSITLKKGGQNSDGQPSLKLRSQSSGFGTAAARKKKNGYNVVQQNNERIQIETFIGIYRSNEEEQLKRYKVKVIHYNVGQYYCLVVIEEESDEEKIKFLKKLNKNSEHIVENFINNVGKHIYRITEQLRDQSLKELIYTKNPQFLRTVKYESSIVYNSIYNIRSHYYWGKQKVKAKYDKFSLKSVLDDIYDTFQGNLKAQDNRVKFFLSTCSLSQQDEVKISNMYSDISLIKQLLYSLIQNSFDYTEKGYIVLKVTEIPGENDLSTIIKVEVSDSGIGFSSDVDKFNALLNIKNPQFSDNYYRFNYFQQNISSISFGLKNSQKIVKVLGPYSKLFIFTRNGKGSRICFYLYQNMSVFQQTNNHIQFHNPQFEEDLKNLKELYKNEQRIINDKENIEEESSFLGFENITEINIKELEEDSGTQIKKKTKEQDPSKIYGDFSKTAYSNQFQSTQQSKNQILNSPNKRFFSMFSGNFNTNENEALAHLNQMAIIKLKSHEAKNHSANNIQVTSGGSKETEERQRNLSLQDEKNFQVKERATSIFKKTIDHDLSGWNNFSSNQLFKSQSPCFNNSTITPKMNNLDYSEFIDRIQEENKIYQQGQFCQKTLTNSMIEKKNNSSSPINSYIKDRILN